MGREVGHIVSKETRKKLSIAHLGIKLSKEHRQKLSKAQIKSQAGRNGNAYKVEIGYRALHNWVERQLGKPKSCEDCESKDLPGREYHWANISQDYKRLITDWRRLCRKCHKKFDNRAKSLK